MRKILQLIIILFALPIIGKSQGNTEFEISKNLDIYSAVYKQLYLHYAEDFQVGELNQKAIESMLLTLDPYTNYYAEADIEDVRYLQTGKYGGVGASIHIQKDTIVVGSVLKDFPFYNNGIRAGDKLLEADGQTLIGKSTEEMSEILKGNAGSTLTIKIKRSINGQIITKEVKRAEIKVLNVPHYEILENATAYIKLSQFTETAASEVQSALQKMGAEQKLNGLILDLRDNGGGLLQQAVDIMDLFLPSGLLIVETKGKVNTENHRYTTRKPALFPDLPVVVIVNNRSASASEIVAGAFQDYDRGVIIGQKSFGKGLVQKVFPLSYNSQIKITVAKYYIPSGRCIQEINYGTKDSKTKVIADSLRGEFKTKAGRLFKDAGGILPDIVLDKYNYSPFVIDIARNHYIFNFASNYINQHDSIKDAENFNLTTTDFKQFMEYLSLQNYEYTSPAVELLKRLEEDENTKSNQELANEIKKLRELYEKIAHEELMKKEAEITNLIEQEIIARYFFDQGKIIRGLMADKTVKEALLVLGDGSAYAKILKP